MNEKCFVVRIVSSFPKRDGSGYLVNDYIIGITESKEEAKSIADGFYVDDIFPEGYQVHVLITDFPFGKPADSEFGKETEIFRYTGGNLVPVDWYNNEDDPRLLDIYLHYANTEI